MTIEDISSYYSNLTFMDKWRFRRLCYHEKKYYKLMQKLETLEELVEELQ